MLFQAGTTNPTVSLFLVNLDGALVKVELSTPTNDVGSDHILGSVFWINERDLGAIWMNRRQNHGVFVAYDTVTNIRREVRNDN